MSLKNMQTFQGIHIPHSRSHIMRAAYTRKKHKTIYET